MALSCHCPIDTPPYRHLRDCGYYQELYEMAKVEEQKEETFDFKMEVDKVILAVNFLADLKIDQILETISRVDALGSLLDPTAYRNQLYDGSMHLVERLCSKLTPAIVFYKDEVMPKIEAAKLRNSL